MSYYISTKTQLSFDKAIERTTECLKEEGFGVLTDIDMKGTFKKKLDEDINSYRILGACSPKHAFDAVGHESRIGLMLPCNVIVREENDGSIEISAVDPIASMKAIHNDELDKVASEVKRLLTNVINSI